MSSLPPPLGSQPQYPSGAAPARPSNPPAVASLILGIFGCVPWLTGLLAIILGVVGLRRTRTGAGGKGLAVAGLVLGIMSVALWSLFGGTILALILGTAPVRDAGKQFVRDLAEGKPDAAAAMCTADVTRADCDRISASLQAMGAFKDTTVNSISASNDNGMKTASLGGNAEFNKGPIAFTLNMVKQGDAWKVRGFNLEVEKK